MKNKGLLPLICLFTGVSVCILAIGGVFVSLYLPGGHAALLAGLVLTAIVCLCWMQQFKYLPLHDKLAKEKDESREHPAKAKAAHFLLLEIYIALCSISVLCIGFVFRMLYWPGASAIVMCGGLTLAFFAFYASITLVQYMKANEERE